MSIEEVQSNSPTLSMPAGQTADPAETVEPNQVSAGAAVSAAAQPAGYEVGVETRLYQSLSCLTALAFCASGGLFWGWCYAFGATFLALAVVMALDLRWAPLEFGLLWAAVLILVGLRLRRLAQASSLESRL